MGAVIGSAIAFFLLDPFGAWPFDTASYFAGVFVVTIGRITKWIMAKRA